MPRGLVMRVIGVPNFDEPLGQLMHDNYWDVSEMTPFGFSVGFDSRGRMVKAEAYGQLP
jgi:hypothetical protein